MDRRLHHIRFAACVAELDAQPAPPMWPIAHVRAVRSDVSTTTWYEYTGPRAVRIIYYTLVMSEPVQVAIDETAPDGTWTQCYYVFVRRGGAAPRIQYALSRPVAEYDRAILRALRTGS